mmetsp:Transcript_6221/g.19924  ORF Transcript_6221/g.19924 Transcript_6221/m.19924 type:complete len:213 (+) Transcript_6221:432-1070(+)
MALHGDGSCRRERDWVVRPRPDGGRSWPRLCHRPCRTGLHAQLRRGAPRREARKHSRRPRALSDAHRLWAEPDAAREHAGRGHATLHRARDLQARRAPRPRVQHLQVRRLVARHLALRGRGRLPPVGARKRARAVGALPPRLQRAGPRGAPRLQRDVAPPLDAALGRAGCRLPRHGRAGDGGGALALPELAGGTAARQAPRRHARHRPRPSA